MVEQRLIDANAVEIGFDELCRSPYFKSDVSARHGAETLMDLCVRTDSHKTNTIDPETLPIVRQLRDNLAKVTAERDAAVEQLHGRCFACKNYTEYHNDGPCATCQHEMMCLKPWDAVDRWEWKGPQKEK